MITEDTLLLYYYRELSDDEREEVANALARDPSLAAQYDAMQRQFTQWRDTDVVEAPSMIHKRWHDSIDRAAITPARPGRNRDAAPRIWVIGLGAALAAAGANGIGIGARLGRQATPDFSIDVPVTGTVAAGSVKIPVSFTRGLEAHFQESQSELARLANVDDADRILLTLQLVQQNRLFERTAAKTAPNLARVLRAFEPILLKLASEDIAPQDAEALRMQLAFELKVMLTKLEQKPSEKAHDI
jgi:hypothetical protein